LPVGVRLQQHAWEAGANEEDMLDPPVDRRLGEILCPTLVIIGAEDLTDMQAIAAHVKDSVRGAQLVTVSGAAHLPSLEQADEINALLLAFLNTS
jgi:pimeloyl-ACP methyl ester carboxylesterase